MKLSKRIASSGLAIGLLLAIATFFPASSIAAPPCAVLKDNGDIQRLTEEMIGVDAPGNADIGKVMRYPKFGLEVASRNDSSATLRIKALPFRGPAGLYGAPIIQHLKYGQWAIQSACPAVLKLMRVQYSRRCWPSYTPSGPGQTCDARWWPLNGKNCTPTSEGFNCNYITRWFHLGESLRVHIPQGKKKALRAFVEVPDFILKGECICSTNSLAEQGFGPTNELLLR